LVIRRYRPGFAFSDLTHEFRCLLTERCTRHVALDDDAARYGAS
jgi:hypothetical protein